GNAFDQLHQLHGTLKVTGGKLYLLSSENVYEWNGSSFVVFQNERFDDIVVHDNITYLISMAGIKYLKNGSWNELPNIKGTTSISSPHGLFIGGPNGIYQLRIKN
ncbi:MAG: hypothetical protein LBD45_03925, partial [Bacteroidales bacterium]|nr:hypothetical protein [Bacteroidales bacterium]